MKSISVCIMAAALTFGCGLSSKPRSSSNILDGEGASAVFPRFPHLKIAQAAACLDAQVCLIPFQSPLIPSDRLVFLRTEDAGEHWTVVETEFPWTRVDTLSCYDSKSCTALYRGSAERFLISTSDAGLTWQKKNPELTQTDAQGEYLSCVNSETCLAWDMDSYLRTTDGGKSWSPITTALPGGWIVNPPKCSADHRCLLLGSNSIYLSTDSGESWRESSPLFSADEDRFVEAGDCFNAHFCTLMIGNRRSEAVVFTRDAGATWSEPVALPSTTGDLIGAIFCTSEQKCLLKWLNDSILEFDVATATFSRVETPKTTNLTCTSGTCLSWGKEHLLLSTDGVNWKEPTVLSGEGWSDPVLLPAALRDTQWTIESVSVNGVRRRLPEQGFSLKFATKDFSTTLICNWVSGPFRAVTDNILSFEAWLTAVGCDGTVQIEGMEMSAGELERAVQAAFGARSEITMSGEEFHLSSHQGEIWARRVGAPGGQ